MQTIIERLSAASPNQWGFAAGLLLLALLTVQMALVCFGTFRRVCFESQQRHAARERVRLLVKTAQLHCQQAEQSRLVWNGCRKFEVARKVAECHDVYSFYLVPHDGRPLPSFRPGQYLTFRLQVPGQANPLVRCYSLSDSPWRQAHYRVTIKRALCPPDIAGAKPGLASSYFCDAVKEGDILDVKAPAGHFYMEMEHDRPAVLIAGGVGVTPMMSMLHAVLEQRSGREIWFFFGIRNRQDHIFREDLERIAAAQHNNIHIHICYSQPGPEDIKGRHYQHEGRVGVELLKTLLPSNNYDYYLCGPGPFMKSLTDGLAAWGVPEQAVHFEAFGPATVKRTAPPAPVMPSQAQTSFHITFGKSKKTLLWDPGAASLLEFAEANGVHIDAGCRAGNCGSCLIAIQSGEVTHLTDHGAPVENGSCLACVAKPKGPLVLDA